jgi:hypothetical protein
MCLFVSIIVPKSLDLDSVKSAAEEHGLGFSPYDNSKIQAQLVQGERLVLTTRGHCDCGSPLGASADRDHEVDLEAERRRSRTRGWSDRKIQRALEQKMESLAHKRTSPSATRELGVEDWLGFLRHVLEHGRGVSLGLLLHTYRGGVTTERVELARRERVPADLLDARFLTRLREDVVHEFVS